jgi:hypothetical protein
MAKNFTVQDLKITSDSSYKVLYANQTDLEECLLPWQKLGLSYTATGSKIPHSYRIKFEGKMYRLYVTCYSNAASVWFAPKRFGKIFVH